jgi:acyl-CoA thioester hydrolase
MSKLLARSTYLHEVPFHDVDAMGIVWHGHYAKYFELARCELLDRIGFGYNAMAESEWLWPVVKMDIKFVQSAKFGQELEIVSTLKEWDLRLKIDYLIRDVKSGQRVTRGSTVQVAVSRETGAMNIPMPSKIQSIFQRYVDDLVV